MIPSLRSGNSFFLFLAFLLIFSDTPSNAQARRLKARLTADGSEFIHDNEKFEVAFTPGMNIESYSKISGIEEITSLKASWCKSVDSLLAAVLHNKNLRKLDVSYSDASMIFDGDGNYSHVESLSVAGTTIQSFRFLQKFTGLKELNLSNTMFGDSDVQWIADCKSLTKVQFGWTELTSKGISELFLPELEEIQVQRLGIKNDIAMVFAGLPSLKTIVLGSKDRQNFGVIEDSSKRHRIFRQEFVERLKAKGIDIVGNLQTTRLYHVKLSKNEVETTEELSLSDIRNYKHPEEIVALDFTDGNIGDSDIAFLTKTVCLRELSLAGTRITDDGLSQLAKLKTLDQLDLSNTLVTDLGFIEKWNSAIPLTSLIADDTSIVGTCMTTSRFPNLKTVSVLRLGNCQWARVDASPCMTNAGIKSMSNIESLEKVAFSWNDSLNSDQVILDLVKIKTLIKLTVFEKKLSNKVKKFVQERVPGIEILDDSSTKNLFGF